MRKIVKILSGILAGSAIVLAAGFISLIVPSTSSAKQRPQPSFDNSAWIAYWDYDRGLKETKQVSSQLNSVSYFGGALDKDGKVIVLGPAAAFQKEKLPRYKVTVKKYLSVVNDVYENPDDPKARTSLKDTAVLENLLATQESRQAHIQDLFQTVKKYGYDGLEVDYEQVWKNPLVAFRYVKFVQEIAAAADEENLPLRIIFEPSVPANKLIFPEGPEYVIMAYNLYGTHTKDAGPKADTAFIDTVLSRADRLPRPHSIALATGGCVWEEGKTPYFVNEEEALALQKRLKADVTRDAASQALHFTGKDKDGKTVEAWYADADTLKAWKKQALEHGTDGLSLWRLGGNKNIRQYYPGLENR